MENPLKSKIDKIEQIDFIVDVKKQYDHHFLINNSIKVHAREFFNCITLMIKQDNSLEILKHLFISLSINAFCGNYDTVDEIRKNIMRYCVDNINVEYLESIPTNSFLSLVKR